MRPSINSALPVTDTSAIQQMCLAFRAIPDRCGGCACIKIVMEDFAQLGVPNAVFHNYLSIFVIHDPVPFFRPISKILSLRHCYIFFVAIISFVLLLRSNAPAG
jgi:hypothetical protein